MDEAHIFFDSEVVDSGFAVGAAIELFISGWRWSRTAEACERIPQLTGGDRHMIVIEKLVFR
jgi:hypothetical protein